MSSTVIHFDEWALDPGSGELTRRGEHVVLQEQSLQVLQALLAKPGEVVTREELVTRLWPKRVVDFEAGLNAVIRRLRTALHDDADVPRYIETLPRRGYRFIGRVKERPPRARTDEIKTQAIGVTEAALLNGDCLVVTHAPLRTEVGRRYPLDKEITTVGRGSDNDIALPSQSVSRHHMRIERRGDSLHVVDEGSTNGTFLNYSTRPVRDEPLNPGDELRLGDRILKCLRGADADAQYQRLMNQLEMTDALTGVNNRTQFDAALRMEISRAERHDRPLSLIMIDVDHLAQLNDKYGHLTGDEIIRGLAALLRTRLRDQDVVGRCGGGEFCIFMPETALSGATRIADELRAMVERHTFTAGRRQIHVAICVGAVAVKRGMQIFDAYHAADERLKQARRARRDQPSH